MEATLKYDPNNRLHRGLRSAGLIVASLCLFLLIWWFAAVTAHLTALPTPKATFKALISLIQDGDPLTGLTLDYYLKSSLKTFFKGFAMAFVIAVPLGLLLGFIKPLRELFTPMIEVMRPIAPIAWAPIFIISFGYGLGPALVVFIGIFFPLLTNVIFGVQRIDPSWIDASKTLGANQIQIFSKVVLPAAVPYIMNGMKIGLGIGWMCIVAAELYAPPLGGIGFYLNEMATQSCWPEAYSAIIIIAVLGLLTTGVADYVSKIISKRMGLDA